MNLDSLPGTVFSHRYTVQRLVGEEMLGHLFDAIDKETNSEVRLKILRPDLTNNSEKRGRFVREAAALSAIKHPNTVQLLDSGEFSGLCYLVLEKITGETLADRIKRGPLPPEEVAEMAAQIASAIAVAHQEGITHRALHPHNLVLCDDNSVKLRDFGLAKIKSFDDDDDSDHLTQAGARIGNAAYMAPEYIERNTISPKSDLYSLGIVMYEALVGTPPFVGRAVLVLQQHVQDPHIPLSIAAPNTPAWLSDLVDSLLQKNPNSRPSAYQVQQLLEENLKANRAAEPKGKEPSKAKKRKKNAESTFWIPFVASVLMLGVLGSVSFVVVSAMAVSAFTLVSVVESPSPTVSNDQLAPAPPPPEAVSPPPAPSSPPQAAPSTAQAPSKEAPEQAPPDEVEQEPTQEPPKPTSTTNMGTLRVQANKRVLVSVDGKPVGYTPIELELANGLHQISASIPTQPGTRQAQKATISAGKRTVLNLDF